MNIEEHSTEFYECLAHLLYAMVVVDKHVRVEEKRRVKELVERDWTRSSNDFDSQELVYSTLKKLFDESYNGEEAFLNFKQFFLTNREGFSEELKKKIMHSVNEIADAFAGRNKSESILASRLYFLMWK